MSDYTRNIKPGNTEISFVFDDYDECVGASTYPWAAYASAYPWAEYMLASAICDDFGGEADLRSHPLPE